MQRQKKDNKIVVFFRRLWRWLQRAFSGSKRELSTVLDGEIESPAKLLRQAFFRKKTAVIALVILVALFLFALLAPSFVALDINYTDPLQQNVSPGYSLRAVPSGLKKEIASIDGFADFTVGVSKGGKLYVWGNTKNRLQKTDMQRIPKQVQEEGIEKAAAGKDHIIALTKQGNLVGWGDNSCGQYGTESVLNALTMPQALAEGIDPNTVQSITCGYQATALVTTSGKGYVWGNLNAVRNLADFQEIEGVKQIVFTNAAAVALLANGSVYTGKTALFQEWITSRGKRGALETCLSGKKVLSLTASNKCIALLLEDGEVALSGVFENGEEVFPTLQEGEYFTQIDGGTRHFVGVTNLGNGYAWGHNGYGQCEVKNSKKLTEVYAGALQSYWLGDEGKLVQSSGLRGYLMGTDGRGRDVFARIVHGGKTTLTIGGVAVLVSSLIAVVIGCVSGYFGGGVDTFLMRVTEVFSSIPFLPFAMLLSQIIKNYNVSEGMRIFIIMLILGALSWTGLARMIRGQVLAEREKEFVLAARAMGVKESKIAFRHVLPNVVSVILVSITLDFASCLLTESSLSYLGFGVQQPRPTWGNMLSGSNNSTVIQNYWWQWLFPALFLSIAVICINVVGDALRDALDPKGSQEK